MAQSIAHLAATAQPQTASPFFDHLPSEIRQKIYQELWALHDTRWHVHSLSGHHHAPGGPVFPCLVAPDDDDIRYSRFQQTCGEELVLWQSRLRSPWNAHWRCAEAAAARRAGRRKTRMVSTSPIRFRPLRLSEPLLVCKQMSVVLVPMGTLQLTRSC